jgi:hypothetical protein
MDNIDVTFTVQLDRAAIHARGLDAWINHLALAHDADVSTWPEVYHTIALDFLAGGEMSTYVLDQGSSQRIVTVPDDPTPGVDVKAPDTLEAYDGML